MIKFSVAGALNYQSKIDYLVSNGYQPDLVIGSDPIIDHKDTILEKGIELLVCFAYPNILTKEEIALFDEGCINYHSGLPKYRGRHPLNWMLINGVKNIPNAIHFIDEGIDTGDVIIEEDIVREREDDYKSILDKQTLLSQRLMLTAIQMIEGGTVIRRKQNPEELGYTRKRTPEDSKIDWSSASKELHDFVSALVDPMPNAFGYVKGMDKRVSIYRSDIGKEPGVVLGEVSEKKYVISTGDGVVLVDVDTVLQVGDRLK